ncbi:hypothetical protein, partial [Halorhodospira halochloris]
TIRAIDAETGEEAWVFGGIPDDFQDDVLEDGVAYSFSDQDVHANDITGSERGWVFDGHDAEVTGVTVKQDTVYSIDKNDNIYAIDIKSGDGSKHESHTDGILRDIAVIDDTVYSACRETVRAIDASSGTAVRTGDDA